MRSIIFFLVFMTVPMIGCKETVIEYRTPKEFTNDLLHGDIVGKVKQADSKATVVISQVAALDSAAVNPQDGSFAFRDLRVGNYDITIRSNSYRVYSRSNVAVQGGGVTFVGEIDLSTVPDLVDQYYPANNSEIVYDWRFGRIAISILFTHPMDRLSVEKAFSTSPPSEGVFIWGNYTNAPLRTIYADAKWGSFEPGATITTFSKVTSLTYSMSQRDSYVDTLYVITLSTEAHDTSGNHLRFPLQFSFRTVQSYVTLYGIQTSPMHGDIGVDPLNNSGINITFPRRMDPGSTEFATAISPPMNQVFLWPDGNVLKIYTGGPFLSDTTITVYIAGSARDRDGVPLGQAFSFWFRTAPFQVTSTSPANAQLFVPLTQSITFRFNSYATLSSIPTAFSIVPAIAGSFTYGSNYPYDIPSEVVFTPSSTYRSNTKYTITLTTAAKDMYGVSMKAPFAFSFVTRPN